MADTDPPAATPDLVVMGEYLLHLLHYCLTRVARFTMRPAHYEEYSEIVSNFDARNMPYEDFRHQMVALLAQSSNYAHLRVYWDVFDRVIIGEEQGLQDSPLYLYPAALFVLLNVFLYSAQIRDPLWNVQQERILASQRELSRIRSRRYHMAGGDSIRAVDPGMNPEWYLVYFLEWFQDSGARIVMGSEDYDSYVRLMSDQCHGRMPYDRFMEEMGALLRSRNYQFLRLWWHIQRMDVCGVRRMVDNPYLRFPLALCVTLNIVVFFAMFGDYLWNTFVDAVRQRDDV